MRIRSALLASTLAAAAALCATAAFAEPNTLSASDVSTMGKWYGRAGGPVGADRITALNRGNAAVTVTYDAEIAARTNMPLDRATGWQVTITYDREIAARTNMGRATEQEPVTAAGIAGAKSN